jgi:hypothetical protein
MSLEIHFKYQHPKNTDLIDPRPLAKRIQRLQNLERDDIRLRDVETGIHMMLLCAGNQTSPSRWNVPLATQYLFACQRLADYYADRIIETPDEVARSLVLCLASSTIKQLVIDSEKRAKKPAKK